MLEQLTRESLEGFLEVDTSAGRMKLHTEDMRKSGRTDPCGIKGPGIGKLWIVPVDKSVAGARMEPRLRDLGTIL